MLSNTQELSVGDRLPEFRIVPSVAQIFRYSAITWNSHAIHYDHQYAQKEGYPAVLVQSHLHGAFLTQYCTDWMGEDGQLVELGLAVRRYGTPGDALTVVGVVTDLVTEEDGSRRVSLDLTETRESDGEACAQGQAVIRLLRA